MLKKICSWIIGVILTVLVLLIGIFAFWYFGSTNYHLTGVPVLNTIRSIINSTPC